MLNHNVGFQSETHKDAGWLEQYTMPDEFDTSAPERRKSYWDMFPGVGPDAWKRDYLEAVYHHLNLGVYYCAAVMNSIIDKYWKCEHHEDDPEELLRQSIQQLEAEYNVSWLLSFVGNWATIIILTRFATSKLKGKGLDELLKELETPLQVLNTFGF